MSGKGFDICFHFGSRGVAVFEQEGVNLTAIEGSQSLDNVVSINYGFVI